MAKPILQQLNDAWRESGMTQTELAAKAGLDQPSVSRKLRGETPMTIEEAEALARALKLKLLQVAGREARAS